jgi:hypothetical protein
MLDSAVYDVNVLLDLTSCSLYEHIFLKKLYIPKICFGLNPLAAYDF